MRKKTIYLHLGTPKTGTTSIQEYLTSHAGNLYKDGYLVPETTRHNQNTNHIYLANYALNNERSVQLRSVCLTDTEEELHAFRKRIYRDLREEIEAFPGDYVILSNEHCYRCLNSREETMRLRGLLEGLAERIEIIIYLREQSAMLCSHYSTSLKNNSTKLIRDLESFSRMRELNYNHYLKVCEDVFGKENIKLRIYDREKLYDRDIISDFCQAVKIPHYDYNPVNLNVSLNAKQCEFLRIFNSQIGELKGRKGLRVQHNLNQMVNHTQIQSPPVSALISQAYQQVYEESNRDLVKRYFDQDGALFQMKPLKEQALDQRDLLTEGDKKNLANQLIEKYGSEEPMLCKCIAAIFDVSYKNKRIPMDYVQGFDVEAYEKSQQRTWSFCFALVKKILNRVKRRLQ